MTRMWQQTGMDIVPSGWDVMAYWYSYGASLADVVAYSYGQMPN